MITSRPPRRTKQPFDPFRFQILKLFWILSFGFWIFSPPLSNAQSLSSDIRFVCGAVNTALKVVTCSLQVTADTIGSKLMIEIPREKVTQVTNLKKGDGVSPSGLFFHLDVGQAGNNIALRVDFADLKAKALSSSYALFQFDLGLVTAEPSAFPMTINTLMKTGSELHTPTSLAQNTTAFTASTDVILPITLSSGSSVHTAAPQPTGGTVITGGGGGGGISSSFSFSGGGAATKPVAPEFYCFADPRDSMTTAEWTIVCDAKSRGIISGNPGPDGTFLFLPNQPVNRAEAVKIVTLGILRSLGALKDGDFSAEQSRIDQGAAPRKTIEYPDISYESDGMAPWFAVYVSIATRQKIVGGYLHDGTYKPANKINNAESYRVIGETGRVASRDIADALDEAILETRDSDWFMKYAELLDHYAVPFSRDYSKFTTRKEFLIMVMNLLKAVGL